MDECEVSMASEVNEFEHNDSLCINFNETLNGEEYENCVLNIQDEKQVANEDLHLIVDRIEEYPPLLGRGILICPAESVVEHDQNTRSSWVDAVKKPCLRVKAKVKEEKLGISIVSQHESVQTLKQELDILKANVLKAETAANHDKEKKVKEVQARVGVANDARHTPHAKLRSVGFQRQEKVDVKSSDISIVQRFGVLDDCSLSADEIPHVEAEAGLKGQKLELLEANEAHKAEAGAELKAQMETEKREKKMEKRLRKKQKKKKIVATNVDNKIWMVIWMIIICLVYFGSDIWILKLFTKFLSST